MNATDPSLPPEPYGFLLESPSGLVHVGNDGARAFPIAELARVSTGRSWLMFPSTVVRLEEPDGDRHELAFMEEGTFRGNRALALALGARLARPRPGTPS